MRKIINKVKEILTAYWKMITSTKEEKEVAKKIQKICGECPELTGLVIKRCGICHCPIRALSNSPTGECSLADLGMKSKWKRNGNDLHVS